MVHDAGTADEARYVWLNPRPGTQGSDDDVHLSASERAELHALRVARSDLIEWCDDTKGPTAVLIRKILDDAEARQRLACAGLSPTAVEKVLRGEEIGPGIRVLVDGDELRQDDDG
jgi:hypothetical protein